MYQIELNHNFETAHRLSNEGAPFKCRSIHGHSWNVTAFIESKTLNDLSMVVEFGLFKKAWRQFIDDKLDHYLVLSESDPVADAILDVDPSCRILKLHEDPTTEILSQWIFDQTVKILRLINPTVKLVKIHVQETRVNAASFTPSAEV